MDFKNKTALVTGAGSGMGLLFCQEFIRLGGNAALVDVNLETAQAEAQKLNEAYPDKALALQCDVRDYKQVCLVRDETVKKFGSIDVLVNFAGGAETRMLSVSGEFPDIPIEVYDWGIDVNLKGQFYFDHAVMKQMREQKSGVIVNIGSITGEEGCETNVAYSASKSAAMNGLTKSIAQYGSRYGVRCICISPGPVLTRPGMANMKTALGRAASPQEMIDLTLFAVSEQGSFLDGINILSDGGRNVMKNKE